MASLMKRGQFFPIQHYVSGKLRRVATGATVLQIAKEKLRRFESAQARGEANPLPSRTPIPQVVAAYVQHIRRCRAAALPPRPPTATAKSSPACSTGR